MTHELYKTKEEIESWLNQYEIKNYELIEDKEYVYVVDVNKDVKLNSKEIKEIKVKFNIINGFFSCEHNKLKSLYGCPEVVNGNFSCSNNELKSLKYCPKKIEKDFFCNNNKIINLKGSPNFIYGDFYCNCNELETLNGCPEIVNGNFYCNNNELTSLEYCPTKIKGNFFPYNNQINSLEHFPKTINGEIYLDNNDKLGEVKNITNFEELKKIHELIVLNKKLHTELNIENNIKNFKIKI